MLDTEKAVSKPLNVDESQLSNGATLLHKRQAGAPRLAMSMFLPGGNLLDPVPGLSDVVDRLLLKGTRTRSQEDISIEIDGMTLEVDSDTKRDYSVLHATLLEEDLEASLALISDFFHNATLEEFDREKQKMAGEVMMDLDSPKGRASDQFVRAMFEGTSYGIVGSVMLDNFEQMNSLEQAREHYRHAYHPGNLIVSVVGDIEAARVAPLLEKYFPERDHDHAEIAPDVEARIRKLSLKENQIVTFARDDSSQAHIFKGWHVPDVRHPDYFPLAVMNTILGAAGLSSRLFLELRDKQGLAYNVRSTLESYKNSGMFYLYIGTEPKNKDKCLKGFIEECDKLINIPVGTQELAEAKRNILGRRSVFLETASQQANHIGANYTMGRSLAEIESITEKIEAVTPAEIQRVSQLYLTRPSVVSVVGPSSIL